MKILKTRVKCCHFNNSTYGEIPIGRFPSFEVIFSPEIIWSILFLGVVASMLCFLLWNWVMRKLGAVVATNWVYFNPNVSYNNIYITFYHFIRLQNYSE